TSRLTASWSRLSIHVERAGSKNRPGHDVSSMGADGGCSLRLISCRQQTVEDLSDSLGALPKEKTMSRVLLARSKVLTGLLLAVALLASGSMQIVKADH